MISDVPIAKSYNKKVTGYFDTIKEVVSFIRNTRFEKKIGNKDKLDMKVKKLEYRSDFDSIIRKLANLSELTFTDEKVEGAVSFINKAGEFYLMLGDLVNNEEEIQKLEKELEYSRGFLSVVMKKLGNDRFVNNAPEKVIEMERKKKENAENKIKALEERIALLNG